MKTIRMCLFLAILTLSGCSDSPPPSKPAHLQSLDAWGDEIYGARPDLVEKLRCEVEGLYFSLALPHPVYASDYDHRIFVFGADPNVEPWERSGLVGGFSLWHRGRSAGLKKTVSDGSINFVESDLGAEIDELWFNFNKNSGGHWTLKFRFEDGEWLPPDLVRQE